MKVELWPIERLRADDANARSHGRRNLDALAASLARFGQRRAAVVRADGRVLAGNGMLEAARKVGLDRIAVTVVPDGWSDDEARAFALADNRTAELASWDSELLGSQLEGLVEAGWNVTELGFDEPEPILGDDEVPPAEDGPTRSQPGDLWLLGDHRLVVGDATDLAVVERAAAGPVEAVWTDPPYGVAYVGGSGLRIKNDDLKADALGALLVAAFTNMAAVLRPGGAFYICSPSGQLETVFRLALQESGLELRQQLVWAKDAFVLGRADYHGQHETILYGWRSDALPVNLPVQFPVDPGSSSKRLPEADALFLPDHETVLYGWKAGKAHKWNGGRKQSSVWQYDRPRSSKDHPTMKPVPLVARGVMNSTDRGGLVLDPFGGSGSTLAACEQIGRRCATVELDPRYADVIIARWESLSGGTAVRADG